MKTFFGVCSDAQANLRLKNGYTLYDWIKRQRCFPAFWGRTLLGENCITEEEIDFLRSQDCKVLLIARDLSEATVSGINGTKDALRAAEAARALGVPAGTAIFAQIEPHWSVNHNWMLSFAHTMVSNGYVPGFIGNTDSSKNFNFDRQYSHYVQATKEVNAFGAVVMATEPKCKKVPAKWAPYCPSALEPEDIQLWACGMTTFDKITTDDVYAQDEKILAYMW